MWSLNSAYIEAIAPVGKNAPPAFTDGGVSICSDSETRSGPLVPCAGETSVHAR